MKPFFKNCSTKILTGWRSSFKISEGDHKVVEGCVIIFFLLFFSSSSSFADDYLNICMKDGTIKVFSKENIAKIDTLANSQVKVTTTESVAFTYDLSDIQSMSYGDTCPETPAFTSFGFKKKLNEQITESKTKKNPTSLMEFSIAGIGKYLTPSFTVNVPGAKVTIDGVEQTSKKERFRFDHDINYKVSWDGYEKYVIKKTSEEVWSEEVRGVPMKDINLTADMLSTNAPSNVGEDLANLLDGDASTIFHSTWGTGTYTKLPLDSCAYIDVRLPEAIHGFEFYYKGRNVSNYNPLAWRIYASHDGQNWTVFKDLTIDDGLPQGDGGQEFTSKPIILDGDYEYLCFEETKAEHKNYIALSEFRLYEVTNDGSEIVITPATLITPASYEYVMEPLATDYTVRVNWLTDQADNVPRIEINVDGGKSITSKEVYLHAFISFDGNGVFDSMEDSVWVKGRGNTSWSASKKPYRLKFDSKVKPFGLEKGKSWVLLANSQTGSMMSNALGYKIARLIGTAGANNVIPVELYINGNYMGSYNFTEKVGIANNSVDINELNSVMLELDEYYDEAYKFKSSPYSLPVNIKEPDMTLSPFLDNASFYLSQFQSDFNALANSVYNKMGYWARIDVDVFCRFMLANDLILNYEINHPKSTFLYKDHTDYSDSKYVFGPVWDLDWAFGYEDGANYYKSSATSNVLSKGWTASGFFKNLLNGYSEIRNYYKKLLDEFMANDYQEFLDYAQDYYDYANPSFEHNSTIWNDGGNYYSSLSRINTWFTNRTNYLVNSLASYDASEYEQELPADVNLDGTESVADVVEMANYLNGDEKAEFRVYKADIDEDNEISASDEEEVINRVMSYEPSIVANWRRPFSDLTFAPVSDADASSIPVEIDAPDDNEEDYSAIQFDLTLPKGMSLSGVELEGVRATHHAVFNQLSDTKARVLVFSDDNAHLVWNEPLLNLLFSASEVVPEADCKITISDCVVANSSGDEYRLQSTSSSFIIDSGIDNLIVDTKVRGGEQLSVDVLKSTPINIYTVGGVLVRSLTVSQGHTDIQLPHGIYIVNKQKVVIK